MPRSPSPPATPGAVVEESASPPKPGLFARLFKKAPKVDDEAKTPSPEKPKKKKPRARGFEPLGPSPARSRRSKEPDELTIATTIDSQSPERPPRPKAIIGPDGKRDASAMVARIKQDRLRREKKLFRLRAQLAHLDRRPAAPPPKAPTPLKLPPDDPTFAKSAHAQVLNMLREVEDQNRASMEELESTLPDTTIEDPSTFNQESMLETVATTPLILDKTLTDGEAAMLVASRTKRWNACDAAEAAFRREPPQRAVRKDWVMAIATDDRDGPLATIEAQRALSIEVDSRKPEQFGLQIPGVFEADLTDAETGRLVARGCKRANRYTIYDAENLEDERGILADLQLELNEALRRVEEAEEADRLRPGDQEKVKAIYKAKNDVGPIEEALDAQERRVNRLAKEEKHLPQQTYANERSRMRSSTTIVGCARRDDPWIDDGDLLTAASLRMDLRVSLRGPYWGPRPDRRQDTQLREERPLPHVEMTYACPCGSVVDRAFRDDHRRKCRLFRESWEELLRRLVEHKGRPEVRRLVGRVGSANLCDEASAFCALAICGGTSTRPSSGCSTMLLGKTAPSPRSFMVWRHWIRGCGRFMSSATRAPGIPWSAT